jgi:hypothetical protein
MERDRDSTSPPTSPLSRQKMASEKDRGSTSTKILRRHERSAKRALACSCALGVKPVADSFRVVSEITGEGKDRDKEKKEKKTSGKVKKPQRFA